MLLDAYLVSYKYRVFYSLVVCILFFSYQVKRVISIQQIQALWVFIHCMMVLALLQLLVLTYRSYWVTFFWHFERVALFWSRKLAKFLELFCLLKYRWRLRWNLLGNSAACLLLIVGMFTLQQKKTTAINISEYKVALKAMSTFTQYDKQRFKAIVICHFSPVCVFG